MFVKDNCHEIQVVKEMEAKDIREIKYVLNGVSKRRDKKIAKFGA